MRKTTLYIKDMDCPCEENIIKMKLAGFKVSKTSADFEKRHFTIIHQDNEDEILRAIDSLNLNSSLLSSCIVDDDFLKSNSSEKTLLVYVLAINFAFFILEMTFGLLSSSMGLVADSLDMLSDSLVYIMALFVVGRSILLQKRVAFLSGVFQIFLAFVGVVEVVRRALNNAYDIDYKFMIIISFFALIANYICLKLLSKSSSDRPHIKASMIFTSNDIMINLGVILAGILVVLTGSNIPDLIIGSIVFVLVCKGAFNILSLSR